MTDSDYRTASEAEIQREADRMRRAKQALENHRKPPRTPGARIADAIQHTKKSRSSSCGLNNSPTDFGDETHENYKPPVR